MQSVKNDKKIVKREGRQMAPAIPRSDISRLTFGVSDNLRLDFLRQGHFPAKTFGSWTLGVGTSGAWKFGAPVRM